MNDIDEEVGGKLGMQAFLTSNEWKKLNVGFALDEGLANPTEEFTVFYGERMPWCNKNRLNNMITSIYSMTYTLSFQIYFIGVKVTCQGNPGHGSRFIEGTAAEKLHLIIDKFLDFRRQEKNRLEANQNLTLGDVTTVNLTKIEVLIHPPLSGLYC